jgi:hypothetical protein
MERIASHSHPSSVASIGVVPFAVLVVADVATEKASSVVQRRVLQVYLRE